MFLYINFIQKNRKNHIEKVKEEEVTQASNLPELKNILGVIYLFILVDELLEHAHVIRYNYKKMLLIIFGC